MSPPPRLVFVYNADSGLFNVLADAAHKIVSPETYGCSLCRLTYGWVREKAAWRAFVAGLPAECEFLHRDQAGTRFPGLAVALPAVLRVDGSSAVPCLDADDLNGCGSLDDLMELLGTRCLG